MEYKRYDVLSTKDLFVSLEENGVAVVPNRFTIDECKEYRNGIWQGIHHITQGRFNIKDKSTSRLGATSMTFNSRKVCCSRAGLVIGRHYGIFDSIRTLSISLQRCGIRHPTISWWVSMEYRHHFHQKRPRKDGIIVRICPFIQTNHHEEWVAIVIRDSSTCTVSTKAMQPWLSWKARTSTVQISMHTLVWMWKTTGSNLIKPNTRHSLDRYSTARRASSAMEHTTPHFHQLAYDPCWPRISIELGDK